MRFILLFQLFVCFSHLWGILLCLNVMHGHKQSLECWNDYLYTIMCELNMTSEPQPHDALYWLEFYDEREPFECVLMSQTYPWVCVLNLSTRVKDTFLDTDSFQISLNYSFYGNNRSVVLEKAYRPVHFIRPVPPSNLMLLWKPDEIVFSWSSGYKQWVMLVPYLTYQLCIHRNGTVRDLHSTLTNVSVPMSGFVPNTNYEAHVRSKPQANYKGVWSRWGPAIHWTTGPANFKKSTGLEADTPDMSLTTVCLALLLLPVIFLCYFLYARWKRCVLNPSPAPHIGEFKCLMMLQDSVGELLQREASLQIDSLTEDVNSTPDPNPAQNKDTSNNDDSSSHTSFTDSPGSPRMLQSGSKVSMSSWVQVLMSAKKGSVTYSDDYCTLTHTSSEHAVNIHKC